MFQKTLFVMPLLTFLQSIYLETPKKFTLGQFKFLKFPKPCRMKLTVPMTIQICIYSKSTNFNENILKVQTDRSKNFCGLLFSAFKVFYNPIVKNTILVEKNVSFRTICYTINCLEVQNLTTHTNLVSIAKLN